MTPAAILEYYSYDPDYLQYLDSRDTYHDSIPSSEGRFLRDRKSPSVLELMETAWRRERLRAEKRLAGGEPETTSSPFPGGSYSQVRDDANTWVRCMEKWQPGNIRILREHFQWLHQGLVKAREKDSNGVHGLTMACEEMLVRRIWCDDSSVLEDYRKLLLGLKEDEWMPLKPLVEGYGVEGMDALVEELFLGPKAPMRFENRPFRIYDSRDEIIRINSPVLSLPAFRKVLLEALNSQSIQASLEISDDGAHLKYHADRKDHEGSRVGRSLLTGESPAGTSMDMRLCDLVVYHLSSGSGLKWMIPGFELDAPVEERNKAIAEWRGILSGGN